MSDRRRVLLAGATGLVGQNVMECARSETWLQLVAIARRETSIPRGSPVELLVTETAQWPDAVASIAPDAVICAVGTTIRKAGSQEAFRVVDHDIVVSLAEAAKRAGVQNFVLVSSVGANAAASAFYLRVKGEVEAAVTRLRFRRLDIIRPGLLRGKREGEVRLLEQLAVAASPVADVFLFGSRIRYRSIAAATVAEAAIQCARERAGGQFVHEHEAIKRLARRLQGAN